MVSSFFLNLYFYSHYNILIIKFIKKDIYMKEMNNLKSNIIGNNIIVSDKRFDFITIPFFKTENELKDKYDYVNFIKATERMIRSDDNYTAYVAHLKENVGLNRCSLYGNITGEGIVKIEMNHGPILTLYDYVEINLKKRLIENKPITTFDISEEVLDQHKKDLIQVVMLSEAGHRAFHPKKEDVEPIFIDMDLCYGDIIKYIKHNIKYFTIRHLYKVKEYLDLYKRVKKGSYSPKYDIFKEFITKWNVYK